MVASLHEDPSATVEAANKDIQSLIEVEREKRAKELEAWPAQFSQTAPWRANKLMRCGAPLVKKEVKEKGVVKEEVVKDEKKEAFQQQVTGDVEKLRRQIMDEHDEFVLMNRTKGVVKEEVVKEEVVKQGEWRVERSQQFMKEVIKKNVKLDVQKVMDKRRVEQTVKKEVVKKEVVKRQLKVVDVDPKRADPKWANLKPQPKWLAPRQPLSKSKASPGAVKPKGTAAAAADTGLGVNINL